MTKTATIRARIEPRLKQEVEKLFEEMGLTTTEAINLFYRQVKLRNGLPFNLVSAAQNPHKKISLSLRAWYITWYQAFGQYILNGRDMVQT